MVYFDRRLLIKNLIVLGKSLMQKCIDPLKANCLRYIALCSAQASMHGLKPGLPIYHAEYHMCLEHIIHMPMAVYCLLNSEVV